MLNAVRRDDGVTLIELVVSMALAAVIGAMALTWFIGSSSADTATGNSDIAVARARPVLQSWSQLLKLAGWSNGARITALTPTSITFYSNLGNLPTSMPTDCASLCSTAPKLVTLSIANDTLDQAIGTQPASQPVLSDATLTGNCLFTAWTANGTLFGGNNGTGCPNTTLTTQTASTQLATITRIDFAFSVTPERQGHMQTYQTSAVFAGTTASQS